MNIYIYIYIYTYKYNSEMLTYNKKYVFKVHNLTITE